MVNSVAVLSDIHGMTVALDRVLAEPDIAAAELIVVTGDHTWGPDPVGVLDRLTGLDDRVLLLRGNADRELLQMSRGIDVGLDDDAVSVWGAQQLRRGHQHLLDVMPEQVVLEVDGFGRVLFCHATPRNDEEVVLVDSRPQRWRQVFEALPPEIGTVVCGHTHMPFLRLAAGRTVINPGSVGLPYGQSGAHWALLRHGSVCFGRTAIDTSDLIEQTARQSGFPSVDEWLDEYVRHAADDIEALSIFGPRDGRQD